MNTGPEIIALNSQAIHIGIVKDIARIEGGTVSDKLNRPLKPFEILFNVSDIIRGARATPLEVNNEINIGDRVLIYSMESIYNTTFYYMPIRNISSPNDTLKFKYNNAIIEFKPAGESADLLLSAGNNLISINSEKGTINLDSLDGISINGGSSPIDIKNDAFSLSKLMDEFVTTMINMKVVVPGGTGVLDPGTSSKLFALNNKFDELLGDIEGSEYYPVVPDDTYIPEFVDEVVRQTGLDILTDDGDYVSGSDPTIDNLKANLPQTYPPVSSEEGYESDSPIGSAEGLPVTCTSGEISNNLKLSDNYTVASLTIRPLFPHKLKAQVGLGKDEIACNLKALANNILEPLRAQYPNIRINSAFRASASIQGKVSQHQKGEAVDIQIPGIQPSGYMEVANWVKANLPFDQLIFEHGNSIWLHISHKRDGPQRKQLLTMLKGKYTSGLRLHY